VDILPYNFIIEQVNSLPPLPESVLKIEDLFAQGDPNIDDLIAIIEKDPSLTAGILSKVNAPIYGFSKSIVSILQAVTLFGHTQIRSIVLGLCMQRGFDINLSLYGITTSEFSKISIMQSEFIFQWYMAVNINIARIVTPIAFLMETGKILIAKDVLQDQKDQNFYNDLLEYKDISSVENNYVAMTTAQVNALIFEHMNLHESFSESMKYLDSKYEEIPDEMKDIVFPLQIVRTAINAQEQLTENSINKALEILQKHSYNEESFKRVAKRIRIKYME
jgi:HD-like signal output (HDOD) protein